MDDGWSMVKVNKNPASTTAELPLEIDGITPAQEVASKSNLLAAKTVSRKHPKTVPFC